MFYLCYKSCGSLDISNFILFFRQLTLSVSALCDTVRRFAGPMGCVGLHIEGIIGGGLQVPDDLLQRDLTDSLLVFHLRRV